MDIKTYIPKSNEIDVTIALVYLTLILPLIFTLIYAF